ncbi:MAG: DNA-3-methyladenine glycosylase [Planctomycetes bacterium]|nr:DNA-3-methyladenine glycosylase [Planctomycetota bacterium]
MPSLFELPTPRAARALLGATLVHGRVAGTIVETEAYAAEDDPACHACNRRTARTEVFWGEGGLAYVYLCYGLHWCLNVVAHPKGRGGVVLLRAAMPVSGLDEMRRRRGRDDPPERVASGPARLTQAFGVSGVLNGADLRRGEFRIEPPVRRPGRIAAGPRIGITKAVGLLYRYWIEGHPAVSK